MKTTIDIPDATFRRAKAEAALRGQSLRELITEALEGHIGKPPARRPTRAAAKKRWERLAAEISGAGPERSFVDELLRMRKSR